MIKKIAMLVVGGLVIDKCKEPVKEALKKAHESYKDGMKDVKDKEEEVIRKAKEETSEVRKNVVSDSVKKSANKFFDVLMNGDQSKEKEDSTENKD